jgi:prepilin-type N-terminal cleavage/methylation domain-containing protein/prepilin-type processing-associated H-X9-DG protein
MTIESRRSGFSLIELLVVVAIIAVPVGLLLPAVQKVREAANRMSCENNLKQIGLAFHNYHDTYHCFPAGYSASSAYYDGFTDTAPGWGWAVFLLPYIEQGNLYQQVDLRQPMAYSQPALAVMIKTYTCPSDIYPEAPFPIYDAFGETLLQAAPASYAVCVGGDESDTAGPTGLGIFYRNSKTRISDISDGTSNTIFGGDKSWSNVKGIWAGAVPGGTCQRGANNNNPGTGWGPAPELVLSHSHLNNATGDTDGGLDDYSSRHPGGSNVLFSDGHVSFIRSIPYDNPDGTFTPESLAFQALGTRSGGEVNQGLDY